jgi:PIN domain nuclease of toxin-antitoxin system
VRLLLDTHVFIWWDEGAPLSKRASDAIRSAEQVYVSAVTGCEIAIKLSLGRIETRRDVDEAAAESGFEELPLRLSHTHQLRALPWHHRDPFDRMLVAQALTDGLTLVSRDLALRAYGVSLLRA